MAPGVKNAAFICSKDEWCDTKAARDASYFFLLLYLIYLYKFGQNEFVWQSTLFDVLLSCVHTVSRNLDPTSNDVTNKTVWLY